MQNLIRSQKRFKVKNLGTNRSNKTLHISEIIQKILTKQND